MVVYDQVFFGKTPLKIIEVKGDMTLLVLCGEVTYCYTGDGRFIGDDITSNRHRGLSQTSTLSTSPYTLQGFEQKEPAKTYEEALKWCIGNLKDYRECVCTEYVNEKQENALEALRKLVILRDYYNEGWQPDWSKKNKMHFCIRVRNNEITTNSSSDINEFNAVLVFEDYTIRDKFLEEQKELLEIAKPLL